MKRNALIFILFFWCWAVPGLLSASAISSVCLEQDFTLQVLGSGGPMPDDIRASSGYLVWIDGESKFMIDAGGGTFLRFGQADARLEELDLIGITHFHTDHSADLPAILKGGYFSSRTRPLTIAGPSGDAYFPSSNEFVSGLFNKETGVYRYLYGFMKGEDGLFRLEPVTVAVEKETPTTVYEKEGIKVRALGVPHGYVPSVSYRIDTEQGSIAFSADNNGENPDFIDFIEGVDILVMHIAIAEDDVEEAKFLHMPPSRIGEIANEAGAGVLVLSHFMARSLMDLDDNIAAIQKNYKGPIVEARDLQCVPYRAARRQS